MCVHVIGGLPSVGRKAISLECESDLPIEPELTVRHDYALEVAPYSCHYFYARLTTHLRVFSVVCMAVMF